MTAQHFFLFETAGVGLTWENIGLEVAGYRYDYGLLMMIVSMVFFLLLGLYLEVVMPKTYGETLPPFFCFTCCCKKADHAEQPSSDESEYKS